MANYKIIFFDKYAGSIVVKFAENMLPISIDIPLDQNNLFITGQELDQHIQGFIPTWHLDRLEKLKNGIANFAEIELLVTPEVEEVKEGEEVISPCVAEMTDAEKANAQMWEDYAEEKRVAKVLVKFGLLTEDPTTIPNTIL